MGDVSILDKGSFRHVSSVHDANGNLTDDGTLLMEYDALNRLVEVARKSDSQQIAEYAYDADNRRQRKIVTNGGKDSVSALNGTTQYVYHDWRLLEERDGTGAILRQYVYGNGLDEVWTMDDRSGGITVAQLNDGSGAQRLQGIDMAGVLDEANPGSAFMTGPWRPHAGRRRRGLLRGAWRRSAHGGG